jgi:ribosomal peptide maturation radical SAM protein 1
MDVAFAVVPFADVARPSIGVSLLKAGLTRRGFDSKIFYFNVDLAERVGHDLYTFVSDHTPSDSMAGEWFFADVVFPRELPPEHEFVRDILTPVAPTDRITALVEARKQRHEFVERCARALADTRAPIVGFTTTFHQTCACLAIAKQLKQLPNPPVIAFGGANCEGEMGQQLLRSFHWIDYVCTREGDEIFPEFVERFLKKDESCNRIDGLLSRVANDPLTYPRIVEAMDSLPIPDYDDYVASLKASSLDSVVKREIQIETARGCWWGAKHHCTFCGLNGDTMPYRSKSPERVYQEIKHLRERYGFKRIDSVDNILDHRYINTVFNRLADEGVELEMFYEVKANLKRSQLAGLRRGGVTMIQPGIESFSSEILQRMKKGVTGFQNIQLLKWSEEVGILPAWNLLAGFPGEAPEEYDRMAELLPLLTHLESPTGCSPIRLDRFSPLFNQAEESGLRRVRPTQAYYYVFPLGRRELARLAYFFDFDYEDGRKPDTYIVKLQNAVARWRNARFATDPAARPRLDASCEGGCVEIVDTRECATAPKHWLTGLEAELLVMCDTARTKPALIRELGLDDPAELERAVDRLVEARLAIEIDGHVLSLPVLRRRPESEENFPDVSERVSSAANPEQLLRLL